MGSGEPLEIDPLATGWTAWMYNVRFSLLKLCKKLWIKYSITYIIDLSLAIWYRQPIIHNPLFTNQLFSTHDTPPIIHNPFYTTHYTQSIAHNTFHTIHYTQHIDNFYKILSVWVDVWYCWYIKVHYHCEQTGALISTFIIDVAKWSVLLIFQMKFYYWLHVHLLVVGFNKLYAHVSRLCYYIHVLYNLYSYRLIFLLILLVVLNCLVLCHFS